jgi:hypothetical protein
MKKKTMKKTKTRRRRRRRSSLWTIETSTVMGIRGLDDAGLVQGTLFDGEKRQKQSRVMPWPTKSRIGSDR